MSWGVSWVGVCPEGGVCSGGVWTQRGKPPPPTPPPDPLADTPGPKGRHTHLDITLPQTSFVGGKNLIFFQALTLALTLTLLLTLAANRP